MKIFNGNIEEVILTTLFKEGSISTTRLVKSRNIRATKQGVYRTLRKLKLEEKVIIHNSAVSLNDLWVFKLMSILPEREQNISLVGNLRGLRDKEKISIKIKTLTHFDQVWTNIFLSVESGVETSIPLYLYNPHNWLYLLREKTDKIHMKRLAQKNRPTYLIVGSSLRPDKEIKRIMQTKDFKYQINTKIKSKKYIAVLGNYIMQTTLSENTTFEIEEAFKLEDLDEIKTRLFEIDKDAVAKIVVEKNTAKALVWTRRLSKDFI
ncbi:MAG TPA: hypothetical protein ENI66_00500 [Candidatus Yonathbacteria bacterium]|nr:hypothetical protein [Candidatus Yonathbacteria bacterium]